MKRLLPLLLGFATVLFPLSAHAAIIFVSSTADTGGGTLRQAIVEANGTPEEDFVVFTTPGTIRLNSALPNIANAGKVSIANGQTSGVTISGDANNSGTNDAGDVRIFSLDNGASLTVNNLTLRGGRSDSGGAISNNSGTLAVTNCTFVGNVSTNGGGAITNGGSLSVVGSSFDGNTALFGGAILSSINDGTSFTLVRNSTFSGNAATSSDFGGGAIANINGLTRVESCTIANNFAPANKGAGISSFGNANTATRLQNSIVVDNRTPGITDNGTDVDFVFGGVNSFVSQGHNAISNGNAAGAFTMSGDQTAVTAAQLKLGALASNGGPTQTRALGTGSVAIDAGDTAETTDQRGTARPQDAADDIGAFESIADPTGAAGLVVTTTRDVVLTDGLISLREAINTANSDGVASAITFAVTGTITLQGTQLPLLNNGAVSVTGPSGGVTISAGGASRIFILGVSTNATLTNLTLRDGNVGTGSDGGAINNSGATLTVAGCTLTGNAAARGGAIFNRGTLTVTGSTFTDNSASIQGGAIDNSSSGTVTVTGSTFTGNSASNVGGAIHNTSVGVTAGQADPTSLTLIRNCTFVGNSSLIGTATGGAIRNYNGLVRIESSTIAGNFTPSGRGAGVSSFGDSGTVTRVQNSIIADNRTTSGAAADSSTDVDNIPNTVNTFVSQGNNVIGDGGAVGAFNQSGDQTGVTAAQLKLGDLAPNGGPTQTRALLKGSVAIDVGASNEATDQRGTTRPQGAADDVGAFEFFIPDPSGAAALVVTTPQDVVALDGLISLREAITTANSDGAASPITFDATVFNSKQTITLSSSLPHFAANGALSIVAPSEGVVISGASQYRIFYADPNANVTLRALTLSNGLGVGDGSSGGGAIVNNGATLLVDACTLSDNSANLGGAILSATNLSGITTTIRNSTLAGNTGNVRGGALLNNSGLTVIENSTIAGNTAPANAGGGVATSGNASFARTQVSNTIIAGNASSDAELVNGSDAGAYVSGGYNLIGSGNATASFGASGDQTGVADARLDALSDKGGPTFTRALLAGSPAVNKGNPSFDGTGKTDQRGAGFPRVVGGTVDIGAYESAFPNRPPLLNNSTYSTTLNLAFSQQLAGSDPDGDALSYVRSAGTLPPGINLSSSGLLSGTPNTTGQFAFSVNVNDGKDTLTSRFIIIVSSMADAIGPNVSRPALNASYTRDQLAALVYEGTVTDVAAGGATPTGVKQLLFQLRRESDKTAYSGTSDGFTTNVNRGYYSAILSDPVPNTTAGARPFKRTFSTFIPPASVLTVGPYSLVIAAQDVAGNWSIEVVPINIVTAPPVSRLKPATPSGSSALRSSKSASGGNG